MRTHLWIAPLIPLLLASLLRAQCNEDQDHRTNPSAGVLITNFTITGTQTLGTEELSAIESKLAGSCFDENSDEMGERVRSLFQDRGFFKVEVKDVRIKASDAVAVPKPATLEAEVTEGPPYKLADIKITGNHTLDEAKLRRLLPMKNGDLFSRGKIIDGLEAMRKLYDKDGFLDFSAFPNVEVGDATVTLSLDISEGPQYRMGKLKILAKKDVADQLQQAWQLPEGAVFDRAYVADYLSANHSLLPPGFVPLNVQVIRDCPDASVAVVLMIDTTSAPDGLPKKAECKKSHTGE